MKLSILFCLLITFSNLKLNKEFPNDIKTLNEDKEKCMEVGNNQDKCYSISLKTKNAQCCILEYISNQSNSVNCSMIGG